MLACEHLAEVVNVCTCMCTCQIEWKANFPSPRQADNAIQHWLHILETDRAHQSTESSTPMLLLFFVGCLATPEPGITNEKKKKEEISTTRAR